MSKRLKIDGYGQLELNQVAFRRDGRIEAQCPLASNINYVENGMVLAVDKANGVVKFPTGGADELLGLHYSAEVIYDERTQGLKNFKLEAGSFLPRIGYLAPGDRFTTNCIAYDDTYATDNAAIDDIGTVLKYGIADASGAIKLAKASEIVDEKVVFLIAGKTTMPDGQFAIKFMVLKA